MRIFVLSSLLCSLTAFASDRLLTRRAEVGVGVLGFAFSHGGGRSGDLFGAATLEGTHLWNGFVLDAGVLAAMPTRPEGAATGATLSMRAGWSGTSWAALLGASAQWAPEAQPAWQFLPSLRATYAFGDVRATVGVLDLHAIVPAHLSFEVRGFTLGYVAPLGVRAGVWIPAWERSAFRVHALAYQLGNIQSALATVSFEVSP